MRNATLPNKNKTVIAIRDDTNETNFVQNVLKNDNCGTVLKKIF